MDENIPKNLAWAIEASMSGFNCMKKYFWSFLKKDLFILGASFGDDKDNGIRIW
jgi:hypothetical protein